MMYIRKFDNLSKNDVRIAGGKGASLGEMTKAGIPVPPGFVVTTKAFEEFYSNPFSDNLKTEILDAFDYLNSDRVAVRSSAIAEDSSSASWAGQMESYLNVNRKDLLESIVLCFNSINSTRAKEYAKDKGIKEHELSVAVVVQAMVDSKTSGVMFTANPVTGKRDEIIIEAGYGLGELVVQGVITPDNYVTNKNTSKINSKDLGSKDKMYVYKNGKNETIPTSKELRNRYVLNDLQIGELSKLGKRIEDHYGFPCDIEWAFDNDKFYITQSRPITTLETPLLNEQKTNIPEWDMNLVFRWGPIPGKIFYISDYVEAASHLKKYLGQEFPETLLLFNQGQMVWLCNQNEIVDSGGDIFKKYVLPNSNTAAWHSQFEKAVDALKKFQGQLKTDNLSSTELKDVLQQYSKLIIDFWLPTIPAELSNYGSTEVLREELSKIIKNSKELDHSLQILTAPEELSYNQLEEIDLSNTVNIKEHLKKYFWLQNNYSGSSSLTLNFFSDRKNKLGKNIKENAEHKIKEIKLEKQRIINKYNLPTVVIEMADIIWHNIVWQDERKALSLPTFYYKSLLLERTSELLKIDKPILENYFYTELIDALSKGVLTNKEDREYSGVRMKNDAWHLLTDKEAGSAWNLYAKPRVTTQDKDRLSGIVASKGEQNPLVAKAKIVTKPDEINEFPQGSILVTPMTSPEYTILMRKASAVITDTGGLTSHAAIVSREIGIPCIVGTKFATQLIKDGDMLKIDTDEGSITKL